jgi:phosphate transport system protein
MAAEYMIKGFDAEIRSLRSMVGDLGDLASQQITRIADAMSNPESDLARRVVEHELEADRLEHQIELRVVRMLALRQPVASDLRDILAALRIANELERICDHAENIAERITALRESVQPGAPWPIPMARYAVGMLVDIIDAYKQRDDAKAEVVWQQDRELDQMYSGYFRELLTYMMEDTRRLSARMHLLFYGAGSRARR